MTDTTTWGWYSPSPWPGFSISDQDNLDASGNGLAVNPAGYVEFVMRDSNGDGIIYDHDTDDVQPADYAEYILGPTLTLHPQEIALYTGSTMVIGGVTYTNLNIEVTLFEDGSWGARLMDSSIPPGTHHMNVEQVTLGTWNGVEYDGVYTANVDNPFVCFAAQTRIATERGWLRADALAVGDRVVTRDDGVQEILWTGRRQVFARGRHAPWMVRAGAFGAHGTLMLSAQHRLFLAPAAAQGRDSGYLAAIKHLGQARDGRIARLTTGRLLTYVHFLLPRHALVCAEGLWAESLYPGPEALAALSEAVRDDLLARGGLAGAALPAAYGPMARRCLNRRETASLLRGQGAEAWIRPVAEDLPRWRQVPGGDAARPEPLAC
ncbi:Hint domain-containing protein [Phaeovulum sp. W22_SRMD_FR3]|uniref:Hint domain-containing protein n=1 Tax=Phaeovulum sp. W22_SRMD_FR3 TaxID=3240274 RepID=UPI003F9BF633